MCRTLQAKHTAAQSYISSTPHRRDSGPRAGAVAYPFVPHVLKALRCLSGGGNGSRSGAATQPERSAGNHEQNGDELSAGHSATEDLTTAGIVAQEFKEITSESVDE